MQPISSIRELEALDRRLAYLAKDLSIRPGSIFRIACQYLGNWGIELNETNRKWIEAKSVESYIAEWKYGGKGLDDAIERAVKRAGLSRGNFDLNTMLAEMTVQIILSMHDEKRVFRICDIGAGAGSTSEALLDRLATVMGEETGRQFARRFIELYLVEPSMVRLSEAFVKLEGNKLKPKNCELICAPHTHIGRLRDGEFDFVISSAVFHHMSFPRYLSQTRQKLAEDGVMVIGDWYHLLCHHPAYIVPLLLALEISPEKLMLFKHIFNVDEGDEARIDAMLTPQQLDSKQKALLYLAALGEEMRPVNNACFMFLEALESFGDRKRKIKEAGFETDIAALRKEHKGFISLTSNVRRAYPNNDITSVISAARVPAGKRKLKMAV